MNEKVIIGVDVGSGSARAGVFDIAGNMLARVSHKISLHKYGEDRAEQSSSEIWQAVCDSVKQAVQASGISPKDVVGIGFDATCSLVVIGDGGTPLSVSENGDSERNVIVWMDHRATKQAERINTTDHPVLQYVGGSISPEMETPKLLWLKENLRKVYDNAWQFFDLVDFLTWRATGDLTRSVCTLTCKWTYLAHEKRWDADYFRVIGLEELADEEFFRIGQQVEEPGKPCGQGLTKAASIEMGLPEGIPVAVGLIDAHAGGVGTVGVAAGATKNVGYVFGTSSCTMTSTSEPVFVPGVWGPYYSAMVPGMWLSEGGQSAAGAAIDRLLLTHPVTPYALEQATQEGLKLPVWLANHANQLVSIPSEAVKLAGSLHVVPEFLGNRAPFSDPHSRAVISGLGMEQDLKSLIGLYIAGLCGIGYGLRQILEAQNGQGINIDNVVISGGAGQHSLVRQLLADACGLTVISTQSDEPVLLGAAILGSVAGGINASVKTAMENMVKEETRYEPCQATQQIHNVRYEAWKLLQQTEKAIRKGNSLLS